MFKIPKFYKDQVAAIEEIVGQIEKCKSEQLNLSQIGSGNFASQINPSGEGKTIDKLKDEIAELRQQAKFQSPLSFLYYEFNTVLDDKQTILDHLDKALPCRKRIDFILQKLDLTLEQLPEKDVIKTLLQGENFKKLKDKDSVADWVKHEYSDPLWGNYELQILKI